MNVSSARYQLAHAFKQLKAEWERAGEQWRDEVREDFGRQHYDPLASRVSGVLTAMDQLDQLLAQMQRECGDEFNL